MHPGGGTDYIKMEIEVDGDPTLFITSNGDAFRVILNSDLNAIKTMVDKVLMDEYFSLIQ